MSSATSNTHAHIHTQTHTHKAGRKHVERKLGASAAHSNCKWEKMGKRKEERVLVCM